MVTLEFNHLFPLHFHKGKAADDEVWHTMERGAHC